MKKLIYTMTVSCLFFGLGSCDQEIDYPYEGKDRIYFDCLLSILTPESEPIRTH